MKPYPILLAVVTLYCVCVLAGCGGDSPGSVESPVVLAITDVSMPDTATANQPVTYSATVLLKHTRQVFTRFAFGRTGVPIVVTAYGKNLGGGTMAEHTQVHNGAVTFPAPGVFTVHFRNSEPAITKTITVQ